MFITKTRYGCSAPALNGFKEEGFVNLTYCLTSPWFPPWDVFFGRIFFGPKVTAKVTEKIICFFSERVNKNLENIGPFFCSYLFVLIYFKKYMLYQITYRDTNIHFESFFKFDSANFRI
jgi:hypothetical protein